MASITAELATNFLTLTARHRTQLSQLRATVLPFLLPPKTRQSQSLRFTTSSFRSRIIAVDYARPRGGSRRFTMAATATTAPQSEGSDVSTKIPPDDRIPATIITGFLGSGKVLFNLTLIIWAKY
jgi:hypothetical protein